jgi:hypothetical protein
MRHVRLAVIERRRGTLVALGTLLGRGPRLVTIPALWMMSLIRKTKFVGGIPEPIPLSFGSGLRSIG